MSSSSSSGPSPTPLQKAGWENEPFPIGGARVPDGMADHSDWRSLPEVAVVPTRGEDISEAYVALESKRNAYGELKKTLALVTPTVASIYKNKATRLNTTDEEKLATIDGLIAQEEKRRDEILETLRGLHEKEGLRAGENEFGSALAQILSTVPPSECMEQMTHVAWNDAIKYLSHSIFREQNKMLQAMKAEKKRALAAKAE